MFEEEAIEIMAAAGHTTVLEAETLKLESLANGFQFFNVSAELHAKIGARCINAAALSQVHNGYHCFFHRFGQCHFEWTSVDINTADRILLELFGKQNFNLQLRFS